MKGARLFTVRETHAIFAGGVLLGFAGGLVFLAALAACTGGACP